MGDLGIKTEQKGLLKKKASLHTQIESRDPAVKNVIVLPNG
jgi:hypothetical protein